MNSSSSQPEPSHRSCTVVGGGRKTAPSLMCTVIFFTIVFLWFLLLSCGLIEFCLGRGSVESSSSFPTGMGGLQLEAVSPGRRATRRPLRHPRTLMQGTERPTSAPENQTTNIHGSNYKMDLEITPTVAPTEPPPSQPLQLCFDTRSHPRVCGTGRQRF